MTAADRPSVTDDARAEVIKAHLTEHFVDHDAEEFAWNILNDLGELDRAAGRAETTTATTQATPLLEDEDGAPYPEHVQQAYRSAAQIIHERRQGYHAHEIAQALHAHGLLATARTRPSREQIARALFGHVYPGEAWDAGETTSATGERDGRGRHRP